MSSMETWLEILPQQLDSKLKHRGGDILAACLRAVGVDATFGALRAPSGTSQMTGTVQASRNARRSSHES